MKRENKGLQGRNKKAQKLREIQRSRWKIKGEDSA